MTAKIISRRAGRSATGAAAYRAGVKIIDKRTGEIHDYTRKSGVQSADIVMPAGCTWAPNRSELWNAVEHKNKRADAQLAREFEVALPDELSPDQRRKLAVDFAQEIADRYCVAADVAIHNPGREGDSRNHHAHILTSTNRVDGDGFGNKVRELDLIAHNQGGKFGQENEIDRLRQRWAELTNECLSDAGITSRIDHRSHAERGIDREPTVHLGPDLTAIKRRGGYSHLLEKMNLEIQIRLSEAKKIGQIEREIQDLTSKIIALDTSIKKAILIRDVYLKEQKMQRDKEASPSLDELRAKSRAAAATAKTQHQSGIILPHSTTHIKEVPK